MKYELEKIYFFLDNYSNIYIYICNMTENILEDFYDAKVFPDLKKALVKVKLKYWTNP